MGFGGSKIRELAQKTGVQMSPVDDSVFELFAPDSSAMEEGKALLNSWLEEKVLYKAMDTRSIWSYVQDTM